MFTYNCYVPFRIPQISQCLKCSRDIEGDDENTEFIQLKFCNFVTHFMLCSENSFQASFILNHVALKVVWYSLPSTQITSNIMGVDFYIGLCIGVCRCDLHKQQRSGF